MATGRSHFFLPPSGRTCFYLVLLCAFAWLGVTVMVSKLNQQLRSSRSHRRTVAGGGQQLLKDDERNLASAKRPDASPASDANSAWILNQRRPKLLEPFDRFKREGIRVLNQWIKYSGLWFDSVPGWGDDNSTESLEGVHPPDYDSFSACLMVLDENPRLPEWLAYHYFTLPLRHVVVAVDPHSSTSPNEILDRWRDRMTVEVWTDSDFTSEDLSRNSSDPVDVAIEKHQTRQRTFYAECIRHLQEHNRAWTTFTDADEVRIE